MNEFTYKNYRVVERKRNYWRGFIVGWFMALIGICVFVSIIAHFAPKPDYTMSEAQYQNYINTCKSF